MQEENSHQKPNIPAPFAATMRKIDVYAPQWDIVLWQAEQNNNTAPQLRCDIHRIRPPPLRRTSQTPLPNCMEAKQFCFSYTQKQERARYQGALVMAATPHPQTLQLRAKQAWSWRRRQTEFQKNKREQGPVSSKKLVLLPSHLNLAPRDRKRKYMK